MTAVSLNALQYRESGKRSDTGGLNSTTASAEDAKTLALLRLFLSPDHNLTQDFLRRGGLRRKRWL